MYTSLLRDEPLVPPIQQRLRDFYGYLRAIEDILMVGRGLRGRAARRTRAAIGHALGFRTWRSLAREQELADGDAVALMCALVEGAAEAPSAAAATAAYAGDTGRWRAGASGEGTPPTGG
jgi:hypothetical protein